MSSLRRLYKYNILISSLGIRFAIVIDDGTLFFVNYFIGEKRFRCLLCAYVQSEGWTLVIGK